MDLFSKHHVSFSNLIWHFFHISIIFKCFAQNFYIIMLWIWRKMNFLKFTQFMSAMWTTYPLIIRVSFWHTRWNKWILCLWHDVVNAWINVSLKNTPGRIRGKCLLMQGGLNFKIVNKTYPRRLFNQLQCGN